MAEQGAIGEQDDFPEYASRKGEGRMDDDELQYIVRTVITESATFTDNELSVTRAAATEYYLGLPFGNEETGRSQVVLTEVRDAIIGVLPSLLRVIFGVERVVSFRPRRADAVAAAQQATDYVQYVFADDNPGFANALAVLKDGLIRKIGIFKWGWDDSTCTQAYRLEGITGDEVRALAEDEEVKLLSVEPSEIEDPSDVEARPLPLAEVTNKAKAAQPPQAPTPDPVTGLLGPETLYDVDMTRKNDDGRARVWSIPPNEFLYNREARDVETALFIGHRTMKTRGELVEMGVSEEELEEVSGAGSDEGGDLLMLSNQEVQARLMAGGPITMLGTSTNLDPTMGKANNKIAYTEGYYLIDYDGDGVAELRQINTIGEMFKVVYNKPTIERPFSVFLPDPEPHTMLGQSWADRLMDMQRINSFLFRGSLDSLSASIFPRTTYEEGFANLQDLMNTAIGAPIRIRKPGAVVSFTHNFVGDKALPYLEKVADIIERRTGRNKGVAGLDADALQSTTHEGVKAAIGGAQEQAEMLVRLFSEYTLKPLFKGILRLLVEHQPREQVMRLRGKWVNVDPRTWDANMDVECNVALGPGYIENKINALVQLHGEQKEIISTYGPDNPIVTVGMFRDTLAKILELQGIMDTATYLKEVPPNWQPPAPPPPPPTPEETIAKSNLELETLKVQRSLAEKKDELALKEKQMDLDHAFRIAQLAQDEVLKRYQIDAQFHADYTAAQNADDTKREDLLLDGVIKAHTQIADTVTGQQAAAQAAPPAVPTPGGQPAPTSQEVPPSAAPAPDAAGGQ